jgi:hypothetical protein
VLLSSPLVELVRTAAARGKLIGGVENHVLFYAAFSSYLSHWVDAAANKGIARRFVRCGIQAACGIWKISRRGARPRGGSRSN